MRTTMTSTIVKTLATLAVTGSLLFVAAPAAQATPPATVTASSVAAATQTQLPQALTTDDASPAASKSACTVSSREKNATTSDFLPVHRWSGSSSKMHTLLTGGIDLNSLFDSTRRHTIVGGIIGVSNSIMGVTSGVTSMAITFCPMEQAGGTIDRLAGSLGSIVTGTPIGVLVLAIVIFCVAFATIKQGSLPLKTILTKGAILGILAIMVTGASTSTGGDGSNAPYVPGPGSPGWILTNLNTTVAALASAPASALANYKPFEEGGAFAPAGAAEKNLLSCDKYLDGMKVGYKASYGAGVSTMASGIPLIVSNMFEDTGLRTWRTAQFGSDISPKNSNTAPYDDQAWCRLLEWNAGSSSAKFRLSIERSGVNAPAADSKIWKSMAFQPTTEEEYDRSLIGWSACQLAKNNGNWDQAGSWKVHPSFAALDGRKVTPTNCAEWMKDPGNDMGAFKWDTRVDKVRDESDGNEELAAYVNTVHGTENQDSSMVAAYSYPVAAIAILASFGAVSIGIIIAKAMMMVLMITIIVMLIVLLLPGQRHDKAMKVLSMAIGMTLFVFGAQLLFSVLSILTKVISGIGSSMLQNLDLMKVLWVGASPLIAALLLMQIFKMVDLPNPLSMKGALDWGNKMTKGGGGAMFAGTKNMLGKTENKVAGTPKSALSRTTGAVKNKISSVGSGTGGGAAGSGRKGSSVAVGEKGSGRGTVAGGVISDASAAVAGSAVAAGKSDEERSGASLPSAENASAAELDAKALAALRGTRKLSTAERKDEKVRIKDFENDALNWAKDTDSKSVKDVGHTGFARVDRGITNAVKSIPGQLNPKSWQTAKVFQEQGIGAASRHAVKKTAKTALVTAGVVGGTALVGPVALLAAPAALAVGGAKAYRAQGARSKAAKANVTAVYANHRKDVKKAAEKAAHQKEEAQIAKGVSPTINPEHHLGPLSAAGPLQVDTSRQKGMT